MPTVRSDNKTPHPGPEREAPLEDFLDQFPTESTRRSYRSHLYSFLDALYGPQRARRSCSPDEAARYEVLAADLLRQPAPPSVLSRYVVSLAASPPTTAAQRFAVALDWFAYHGHEPGPRERKTLARRLPRGGAQTMEADLDPATLKTIMLQLDLRGRALVAVLASSGMRIGELLKVEVEDLGLPLTPAEMRDLALFLNPAQIRKLALPKGPAEIMVRGAYTKTGAPRIVFISAEAAGAVREWLKVRDAREDLAIARSAGLGTKRRDNRLFPYSSKAVRTTWLGAVRKAGLLDVDPATNRTTLHLHMLRKFFHSQMKLGCPEEIVEMLMGHEGYLSGAYRRYTKRELAEAYARAEMYVTLMVPTEYRALKEETAGKIDTQRSIIDSLTAKSLRSDERLEELEDQAREQQRVIQLLQSVLGAVDEGLERQ
jgi:integrase